MITKEIKFLLTHSSIYGLGTVIAQLVAFFMLPLYTRYLTPTDYGVLETIGISNGIIGIVVTVGIARSLSRFYYQSKDQIERDRVLITTYLTYIALALLFLPILLAISTSFAKLMFQSEAYGYYFKISFISLILGGLIDIGLIYLRLLKKSTIFISITIFRLIILVSLNIIFIVCLQKGVLGILYSTLIVRILLATVMTSTIWFKSHFGFSYITCKELLKYSLPIIPSRFGSKLVKQSDKYFILYFMSVADMGIYSIALKLGNIIHNLLTIPFNMAYIPRRFEIMNQQDATEIYKKIFTYYAFFSIYVGLSISCLIPEIVTIMVAPKFMRAAEIVPIVVLSMVIFGAHFHLDFGIHYSKKTKYLAFISIICAALQVTLNILLIPRFQIFGAVWSSVIVLSVEAVMLYWFSKKFITINYEFNRIFTYLSIAIVFYIISTMVDTENLGTTIFIKLFILILFPVTTIILRIIRPEEKEQLYLLISTKVAQFFKKISLVKFT
jgi:O-antigen/teichoic acid export membrane protein